MRLGFEIRILVYAWFVCVGSAVAQTGAVPVAPVAAPPDTAVLRLVLPGDDPMPALRSAGPDSISFGGEITVVCALPEPPVDVVLDSLHCDAPWAEVVQYSGITNGEFTLRLRLTRAGPYRLAWADGPGTTQVFHVVGRLGEADQPLPVRDPRRLDWYWWRLLLATLIAAALMVLFRRLRRAPGEKDAYSDPLPPPAWMQAAVDLCGLYDGGLAAQGAGRAFLHELDLIFRRFLAGRFHVKAVEMTPEEIRDALGQRSHPIRLGERFAEILVRCDRLRFSPGEVPTRICHDHMHEVFDAVADTRLTSRLTVVSASLDVEARRCWNRLEENIPQAEAAGSGERHV